MLKRFGATLCAAAACAGLVAPSALAAGQTWYRYNQFVGPPGYIGPFVLLTKNEVFSTYGATVCAAAYNYDGSLAGTPDCGTGHQSHVYNGSGRYAVAIVTNSGATLSGRETHN